MLPDAKEPDFPLDFFISHRGSVGGVAVEVADVLDEAGYKVRVQDFDFPLGSNFVAAMHDGLTHARHFIGLLTEDYDTSPYRGRNGQASLQYPERRPASVAWRFCA